MKKLFMSIGFAVSFATANAQVGIGTNTPDASAQLDITSANKGLLIPRLTMANRPTSPAEGLIIYQTDNTAGFYYYNGTSWQLLGSNGWGLTGNVISGSEFVGTTNAQPLVFRVSSQRSGLIHNSFLYPTLFGYRAGIAITGLGNTAVGYESMFSAGNANSNTAVGYRTLYSLTSGPNNTAMGYRALVSNATGGNNTAYGSSSLEKVTGSGNTGVGYRTLLENSDGESNTAIGSEALAFGATGNENVAIGTGSLSNNIGSYNTGVGNYIMRVNEGDNNTAVGYDALGSNTTGIGNTSVGASSMSLNQGGSYNVAIGLQSGPLSNALTNSIAIGFFARTSANNTVVVGNNLMTSIGGQVGWSTLSDVRFKKDIREQKHGLDFIMQLEPIAYHIDVERHNEFVYGRGADSLFRTADARKAILKKQGILYSGFSAQQVEKAAAQVGYDFSGVHKPENERDHYTLDYSAFVVPLVKGMQEQQEMITELKKTNESLKKEIEELKKLVREISKK